MHTVFVVSCITIYREGLVTFLDRQPELRVVGSSEQLDGEPCGCDLYVLDVAGCGDDAVAVSFLAMRNTSTPFIVVSLPASPQQVLGCLEAGASGYVTREQSFDDLHRVIRQTLTDGACVRRRDIPAVLDRLRAMHSAETTATTARGPDIVPLTLREREVARLLSRSRSNREIARALDISVHTVKHHVRNTLAKLGLERRGDAVGLSTAIGSAVE